jgi:twitching motility two-component system response regulator PilH
MAAKKILVVDDSPTDLHFLENLLTQSGYQVVAAASGEDAITKSKSEHPDLILMDVVMPGINGFQATRTISRDDSTKHIPIIMCTSKNQETDRVWGLRQGAKEYVTKPINAQEVLHKIASFG